MNKQIATTLSLLLSFAAGCGDNTELEPTDVDDAPGKLAPAATPAVEALGKKLCLPSTLRADLPWHGNNRATLTTWLDSLGCASEGYKHNKPPVALFDWDNTVLKNDIGDGITFYLIKNAKVLQPPGQDWGRTSPYMTAAAPASVM